MNQDNVHITKTTTKNEKEFWPLGECGAILIKLILKWNTQVMPVSHLGPLTGCFCLRRTVNNNVQPQRAEVMLTKTQRPLGTSHAI